MVKWKKDPVSKYYKNIETAKFFENCLFYASGILSFSLLLLSSENYPYTIKILQVLFPIITIVFVAIWIIIRSYLTTLAQEIRFFDFLSHAYDTPLVATRTKKYYNNKETNIFRRIAVQTLENTFYSKNILACMAYSERIKIGLYFLILAIAITIRQTDLSIISLITQLVFSEQLFSAYIRTEFLKNKIDKLYNEIYSLIASRQKWKTFEVVSLKIICIYEMAKAQNGITFSSKIFKDKSPSLDKEWVKIKKTLGL